MFPLIFVSSAYVPVALDAGLAATVRREPTGHGDGRVGAGPRVLGGDTEMLLGHPTTWFVTRAVLWSIAILAVFVTLSSRRFARL